MNDRDGFRPMKYGVAAILLGLYAGLSAWIVAGEGEGYRKAIALKTIPAAPPPPPVITPDDRPDPVAKPVPALALGPEPVPPLVDPPKPEPAPEGQTPRAKPGNTAKPKVAARPPNPSKGPAPAPIDHFWDEPDQQKIWEIDRLTVDDERDLGAALHQMVLHDHPKATGGALRKRLLDAAKPYLAARARQDLEYTFTVLDCPRMNVFSHPGGYIYVCKGLFDMIPEDKDSALEFLIAHEIRHVDQAHAITCLKSPSVKKLKLGTVTMFYAVVIPAGYFPEQMDFDADRWAAEQMLKLGRSRLQTLTFLRRLQDYAKSPENSFEDERKKPNDEPRVPLLDNHIRAHPSPSDRIEATKAVIDRLQKI